MGERDRVADVEGGPGAARIDLLPPQHVHFAPATEGERGRLGGSFRGNEFRGNEWRERTEGTNFEGTN